MSIIKVKRSENAGTPETGALKQGELAYSLLNDSPNGGNTLYVGSTDGSDSVAVPVGGKKFTDLLTATPGTISANKAIVAGTAGALGSLVLGDGTTNSTLTSTSLTLPAAGLTFSGGNIVSDGTATITGLPTPQSGASADTVATVGYVTSIATGIEVSDAQDPANTGNIAGADVFTFAGAQGVTTLYNDSTATLTIGLQQQLDVDDDVAFGSVTVGTGNQEVLVDGNVIEQLHPSIFHEFISGNVVGNVFNRLTNAFDITAHGFADGQQVTYTSPQAIDGFVSGTTYYVMKVDDNSFKLSTDEQAPRTAETAPTNAGGSQNDIIQSTSNPVNLFATTDTINIGDTVNSTVAIGDNLTVGGNTVIAGNLTVSGETTTVNTSVMQVDDPVLELGEGTVVDTFDRGIKFHYHDGTTADKIGFMGYDKSEGNFTLLTDTTEATSQVFAGTTGTLVANLTGDVAGNASTASALASAQTFELTGDITGTLSSDLSSGLSIATTLATDVSTSLGDYIKDLQVKGTFDTSDADPANHAFVADSAGSSVIIASANATDNGDIATVDIRLATASRNTAPISDTSDDEYAQNWKNNLGVAEFDNDQFTVTNGWAHIATIDGGTYGS